MLESIREIWEYLKKNENISDEASFVEANKLSGIKHVICVVFDSNGYSTTYTEEYDKTKNEKYLYKQFSHKRYDVLPTSRVSESNKLIQRWNLWFGKYAPENDFWGSYLIKSLYGSVISEGDISDYIKMDIEEELSKIPKDERNNVIFTVKIKENGEEKYLGDFKIFRDIFVRESIKKFYSKFKCESRGLSICSLCGDEGEVYGFASPFSFFTVDKKGFAPNLMRENSWKQLPICERCAISLQIGKEFINKHLSKGFSGFAFYVIPHFIFGEVQEDIIEEITDYENRKNARCLLSLEDDILDILKENNDLMNLIFVFYKRKQGDNFDIVKYVEDVPPSWIKRLFETFYGINDSIFSEDSLKRVIGEKWVGNLLEGSWNGKGYRLSMGELLRLFFPEDKYFLYALGEILSQRYIPMDFLISAFNRQIRAAHRSHNNFEERLLCLKSLYLLDFLLNFDLVKVETMGPLKDKEAFREEKLKSFFEEYSGAFDSSQKKAVFLEGVLAKFLLDVQLAQRQSAPFRSKLKGLKLDKRDIKRLLPEILEKLREYNVAYQWLEREVSLYLLESENEGWNLSNDEISYYFALGLSLGALFKQKGVKNE